MIRKIGPILMAFVYFLVQGPAAYAQESSFWAQRRQKKIHRQSVSPALSISPFRQKNSICFETSSPPSPFFVNSNVPRPLLQSHREFFSLLARASGRVQKVSVPAGFSPTSPLVLHIQDIHGNEQAQRHIGALIESLVSKRQANIIGLEGTTGVIALQRFQNFQNREAVRRAADFLLRDQKISGPIYAALKGEGSWPVTMGVENPALYWANVTAYRTAAQAQNNVRARLARARHRLDTQKKEAYSPALWALDRAVHAYSKRQLSLGDLVNALPPSDDWVALAQFRKSVSLEKGLDFTQVESERTRLISELERRLPASDLSALVQGVRDFRSGRVRTGDFYKQLASLAHRAGIEINRSSSLSAYFRYVELADGIDVDQLSTELAAAEKKAFNRLANTPYQRRLVKQSRRLILTERLAEFVLTPVEWKEYDTVPHQKRPKYMSPFEAFYNQALARDKAMSKNMLNLLCRKDAGPFVGVLVTGGFHAEGMTDQLVRAGASVVSFVPRLENVEIDDGNVSLGLFAQEKTLLENMYQKEKLFLAHPPIRSSTLKIYLPALVTAYTYLVGGAMSQFDANTLFGAILGGVGTLAAIKLSSKVRLNWVSHQNKFSLDVSQNTQGNEIFETYNGTPFSPFARFTMVGVLLVAGLHAVYFDPSVLAFGIIMTFHGKPKKPTDLDIVMGSWQGLFARVAIYVDSVGEEKKRHLSKIIDHVTALMQYLAKLDRRMDPYYKYFKDQDKDYMEDNFITEWLVGLAEFFFLPKNLFVPGHAVGEFPSVRQINHFTFMDHPFKIVDCRIQEPSKSYMTFANGIFGYVAGDSAGMVSRVVPLLKKQTLLNQEEAVYAALDLFLRNELAGFKLKVWAGKINEIDPLRSTTEIVVKSLQKAERPNLRMPKNEEFLNFDPDSHHAAICDGFIEHLLHLKRVFGEEKALAGSILSLKVLAKINERLMDKLPYRIAGDGFLADLRDLWGTKNDSIHDLSFMDNCPSFDDLLDSAKLIRDSYWISPEDRYQRVNNIPPAGQALVDIYSDFTLLAPKNFDTKTLPTHKKPRPPLIQALLQRHFQPNEADPLLSELSSVLSNFGYAGQAWDKTRFHSLASSVQGTNGQPGVLERAQKSTDNEVGNAVRLVELLIVEAADEAISNGIQAAQISMSEKKHEGAIEIYMDLLGDSFLMHHAPSRYGELMSLLQQARFVYVSQLSQPDTFVQPELSRLARIVGLESVEIEALKTGNFTGMTLEGLRGLAGRLGNLCPLPLSKYIHNFQKPVETTPDLAGFEVEGVRFYYDPDLDSNMWKSLGGQILHKLMDFLIKGFHHQKSNQLSTFPMALGGNLLGASVPNILRFYVDRHRLYARFFPEEGVLAIVGLKNKGNISLDSSGKMDAASVQSLLASANATSFFNSDVFRKFKPVAPAGNLGSLADHWAWGNWGRSRNTQLSYETYVLFGAPAWEWIYQVLPLNLWAQRGGADWIMHRFFGKTDSNPVVRQVPRQGVVTMLGLGALLLGLWDGTFLTLALGGVAYAAASAFVFSQAHINKTVANRQALFYLGFVLAYSFIAPSLILFWLDPVGLTGLLKFAAYGATFFMGWVLDYVFHVAHGSHNLNSHTLDKSESRSDVLASDFRDRFLSAERALAMGDWERAGGILNSVTATSFVTNPLEKQWLESLNKRLSSKNLNRAVNKLELKPIQLFDEMEIALFEDRDFSALVRWREKFEGLELTEEQTRLLNDWDEIIHVIRLFVTGKWGEADQSARNLETTARLIIRDHGIFQPYREQLLFGFLSAYWSRRETAREIGVQDVLDTFFSRKDLTMDQLGPIGKKIRDIQMELNDYEQAALNVFAAIWASVLPTRGPHPLPTFVFLVPSPGLAHFKPILYRAMELKKAQAGRSAQPNLKEISDLIEAIVENKTGFEAELNRMGLNLFDLWGLGLHVVAPSLKEILFPGMHEVGGSMGKSDREKLLIRAGNEASFETRKNWANQIEIALQRWERNRLMESLGLTLPLNDLKSLLRMEQPVLHYLGAPIHVRFRLLPGVHDQWVHEPRAGIRFLKEQPEPAGDSIFYVEIVVHKNDLAAVLHEGIELLLTFKANVRYPKGPAHPYGFLAEILANDLSAGDAVPQRALQQLERYDTPQLDNFTRGTTESALGIFEQFPGHNLTLVRKHLLMINDSLFEFALAMKQERADDAPGSYTADIVAMESCLAKGNVRDAEKVRSRAIRRRHHLGKTGQKFKFQEKVLNAFDQQLSAMKENFIRMDERQTIITRHLSVHLEPMAGQLFGFDLIALRESVLGLQRYRHDNNLPEQMDAMNLWWDIWQVLSPVVEKGDWDEADKKFAVFGRKWTIQWQKNGVGRMYLESLGLGFIQQYRRQRDTMVHGERANVYIAAQDALANVHGRLPLSQKEITSLGRSLTMAMVSRPNMYQRENLRFSVVSLKSRIDDRTKMSWTAVLRGNAQDQMIQTKTSLHRPFLIDLLLASPNAEMGVKELNHLMGLYFERAISRHNVIFYLWRNRLNVLAADEWIAFLSELRQPTRAARENKNLFGGDPWQAGYGIPAMLATVWATMAALLAGALFLKGWALLALAATALFAGGLTGWFLRDFHSLNLDVEGNRMVKRVAHDRRSSASAGLKLPDLTDINGMDVMANTGDRPLSILYLDKTMVSSWPNIAGLIEKFSVPGNETGVALVPVDQEALSYVADLPDTFQGRVFDLGRGFFRRHDTPHVPSLREVEHRLEKAGVSLREFTACRVVTPAGMVLDAEGVRTTLFQEALIILLSGMSALVIKRQDLQFIDRAARAVMRAA